MKDRIKLSAALLSILAIVACFGIHSKDRVEAATQPQEPEKYPATSQKPAANTSAQPDSAEPENQYGPSFAFIAWHIFLQAMAPANDGAPTFETWTEQCELTPDMVGCPSAVNAAAAKKAGGNGKVRLLHGSAGSPGARKIAGSDCGAMTTTPIAGYLPPSNLTRNAMYCEEVFLNPVEADFVKRSLTTLVSQQTYGQQRNGTINFPGTGTNDTRLDIDSLEVKVAGTQSTFSNPTFACPDPTNSLYTETINGTCYALAAVHITSKVMPNWLWATFEPNNKVTNPNRCDPKLYSACLDPWGTTSKQRYDKGQTVQQSPELRQSMAERHLNPALSNYFLTGVQTQFVDNYGKPIQMGNSFVEFNQGVPPGKSSCMTCHQYAHFDGKQPMHGAAEANFGRPPQGWPSIGYACNQNQNDNCLPAIPNSTLQDFSWMLGVMPYSNVGPETLVNQSQ